LLFPVLLLPNVDEVVLEVEMPPTGGVQSLSPASRCRSKS
jgi:hypothetical protein